jgi:AhpD family alkylhydroperoxidase
VSEHHREAFGRPVYKGLEDLLTDWAAQFRRLRLMRADRQRGLLDEAFRERLMLAHTSVNECRWCSWQHSREALKEGVESGEVDALLCGVVEDCPEAEATALLYAVHFAETDGRPDPGARARLVEEYGPERTEAIDRALATIRSGNLIGNTFDYVLFRLSGGRLGMKGHVPMWGGEAISEMTASE